MSLRLDFQFSQSSLQDYLACQRRFELRYILRQDWPAHESEPVIEREQQMEMGRRFHQMVQQHLIGLPKECIDRQTQDPDLIRWWNNYQDHQPLRGLPERRYPEWTLTAVFAGYRVVAKYDLLAIQPGQRLVIIDWKTSHYRPRATSLHNRVQSRLYPFLLVYAGERLNGGLPPLPQQVEMIYWFPEFPEQPECIPYSDEMYLENRRYLEDLILQIASQAPGKFPLALDEKQCEYCVYRSLCGRGEAAASWQDFGEEPESSSVSISLDFDQLGEIEF